MEKENKMDIDNIIAGLQNMIDWSDPYEIQVDVLEAAIYYLKLIKLQQSVMKVIAVDPSDITEDYLKVRL